MAQGRVQIRDLPGNQLRSAPVARDTFTQVAAPVPNREAENLIDALGFFNRNLSGLGTAMRQKRQKADDELAQRQENAINLSTTDQKSEISRTGMIGGEPLANARLKKMAGAADGAEWLSGVKEHLVTQNLGELDVEKFIHQQAGEYMKGVNGDPFITGGFARYVDEAVGWAKSQQTSQGLQAREELAQNTTFQYLKTRVGEWVNEGVSPEQLHANVRQFYSEVGAGKDRVTTEALLDSHVMSVASQLVATNPEMAMALITQGRKGEDGTEIGSLADSPRFAPQVAAIVQQGQKVIRDRTTVEGQQANRRENIDRVVNRGDYTAFQDYTINGKTVTAKEQQTQFLQDVSAGLDAQVAAGTMTPAQKRAEVRRITSRTGIEDPFIKSELDGMEKRYSTVDAASDPDYLQDLEKRMALYKEYKETNRNAILGQTSQGTQDFAEAFDLHKRYLGSSTEAAFEFANQVVNPANGTKQNLAFKRDDIVRKVNSKLSGWIKDDSQTYNTMYAGQIEKVAGLFVTSGMDVDTAIDAATERVFENTFHYGGDALLGLEKQNLPEDYQEVLGQMAEDYTVLDARGRKFQGTPTFAHLDGGVIAMRDRDNGTFLEDENGSLIVFNVQHIRKLSAERAKAKDAEAVRSAVEAQRRQRDYEVKRTEGLNLDADDQREIIRERMAPARTFIDFLRDTLGGN